MRFRYAKPRDIGLNCAEQLESELLVQRLRRRRGHDPYHHADSVSLFQTPLDEGGSDSFALVVGVDCQVIED